MFKGDVSFEAAPETTIALSAPVPHRMPPSFQVVSLAAATLTDGAWDDFVAASPDGHLMQCSRWGTLKARHGWHVDRVALADQGRIVAGAQVLCHPLVCGLGTLAYVPMGPVVDWDDAPLVYALLRVLRATACRRHAFLLKVEPHAHDCALLAEMLHGLGLCPSVQTVQDPRTVVVSLVGNEEDVWARFSSHTRQKVRCAQRKGVQVRRATAQEVQAFGALAQSTACRHSVTLHSTTYYRTAYELFVPDCAELLLATHEGHVLAGVFVFAMGHKALCLYAASASYRRELMATYLLQWEAMKWSQSKGCLEYDLCGIPDCDEEVLESQFTVRADGLWGVYGFKRGFGGRVTRYAGAYDDVYQPLMYRLYARTCTALESVWGATWHRRVRSE
ncbi:MAG: lipid II:glycine glycyltransferase FemX [Anaerolineae bacterium]